MKKLFIPFLITTLLLLSACGAKGKETPGTQPEAVPAGTQPETVPAGMRSETKPAGTQDSSLADIYVLAPDHPALGTTDAYGGEGMTDWAMARSKALFEDYDAFWKYVDQYPESALKAHCAGAYTGDINDFRFIILLEDPEDKTCLDEIGDIGLKTDYQIRRGFGTEARIKEAKAEIDAKLEALKAGLKDGSTDGDAAYLLAHYHPEVELFRDRGKVSVILYCASIFYGATGEEEAADRAKGIALFEKYVGKYDVVLYGYPI